MEAVGIILIVIVVLALIIAGAIHAQKKAQERRDALTALANELGYRFDPGYDKNHDDEYAHFEIFRRGHSRSAYNTLAGSIDPAEDQGLPPLPIKMGDFTYKVTRSNGKSTTTTTYRFSYIILDLPHARVPDLLICPEGMFDKLAGVFGFDDIDFESAEFSRRFCVKSPDRKFAYAVCDPRMMEFLMQGQPPTIDIERARCCLSDGQRCWEPAEFKRMLAWGKRFFEHWPEHVVKDLT